MRRTLLHTLFPLLAACSAPPMELMDAGVDSGTPMPSMITATGQLTGTISAPKPTVGYDATSLAGDFVLKKTAGTLPFKLDIAIDFNGMPAASTYMSGSAGFKCDATVTSGTTAADTWVALFNSTVGADKGSCSLTFSSVTMGGSGYSVAGSFSITAAAMGGASSGTVTLMGTF
jgi:hypothetical protein